jgi:predicted phosphodiesterase
MRFPEFLHSFEQLIADSPHEALGDSDRLLVLSDLHLGNGGKRDDLRPNRALVLATLSRYYLQRGFTLVLNGDIEDLSKFDYEDVHSAWGEFYGILAEFHARGRLRKIVGNHDLGLELRKDLPWPLLPSLLLEWQGKRLFLFHGHQASAFFVKYDKVQDFFLRYFARPLGIRNGSVATDSRKRFKTERKIYRAARLLGIVAIAGHTHRPLFESHAKWDSLRWTIEKLIDEHAGAEPGRRAEIRELVAIYRDELDRMKRKERSPARSRSLYDDGNLLIPCYFNSGCGTGSHGYTALEIEASNIALVHWTGSGTKSYIEKEAVAKEGLDGTSFGRYVLCRDSLERVFDRIELLGGPSMQKARDSGSRRERFTNAFT